MRSGGACFLLRRESGCVAPRRVSALHFYPVSLLFTTDTRDSTRKSFVCNRYGKQGGRGYPPKNGEVTKTGE